MKKNESMGLKGLDIYGLASKGPSSADLSRKANQIWALLSVCVL